MFSVEKKILSKKISSSRIVGWSRNESWNRIRSWSDEWKNIQSRMQMATVKIWILKWSFVRQRSDCRMLHLMIQVLEHHLTCSDGSSFVWLYALIIWYKVLKSYGWSERKVKKLNVRSDHHSSCSTPSVQQTLIIESDQKQKSWYAQNLNWYYFKVFAKKNLKRSFNMHYQRLCNYSVLRKR